VVAQESIELLSERAARKDAPWPEFAEYACYSCHHSLADESWRLAQVRSGLPSGAPEWGSWTLALVGSPDLQPLAGPFDWRLAADPLKEAMDRLSPDRERVVQEAGLLLPLIKRRIDFLAGSPAREESVARVIAALRSPGHWENVRGWDGAAQRYLALAALAQSAGGEGPGLDELLEELRRELAFPAGFDSPRGFRPEWSGP
jgi:hypothetical protein